VGTQKNKKDCTSQVRVYTSARTTGPAGAKAAAETASAATTADRSIVRDGQGNGEFPKVGTRIFVPSFHFRTNAVPGTDSKKLSNFKVTCFGSHQKAIKRMLRTSVLVALCASATAYVPAGQVRTTMITAFAGCKMK
jgi:hypothetical protein